MQENKNEITPNQPQQKIEHPAEKLMQYPLKSSGDGIPNTVIRNPELAEEFAYAEKPYRELALAAEGLGLEDEATNILRRGRAAVLRMGIEEDYYKKYDTTRSSVRRAIETGEPEWLNPNHGEVLADIELEKSNEALELQRRHVRALGGGNEGSYEKRYSPDTEAELRSYNKLVSAGGLFEALNYDGLKSTFLRKRRQTLGVLHASISWRKPEAKRSPLIEQAVDKELSEFFVEVYKLQEGGTINRRLAGQVIDRFDIARYTVDDFRAISSNFNFHNLGEMTNLLQGLYAHESNDDIISEHKAYLEDEEQKEIKRNARRRELSAQRSARVREATAEAKRLKQAQKEEQYSEMVAKFKEIEADLNAGREAMKKKIIENPANSEILPLLEQDVSGGSYEAVYSSIKSLKAALTLFTIKRSEASSEGSRFIPYTKLDIDSLWQSKFERPKGYYGGMTGRARLAIRGVTDDESVSMNAQLKRLGLVDKSETFIVDITVEGVKDGEVQMTSSLEGLLYTIPDSKLPIVERFSYAPLKSVATGDTERFQLEKLASIHRAHRVEAEKMSNPMPGGLPGSSKRS